LGRRHTRRLRERRSGQDSTHLRWPGRRLLLRGRHHLKLARLGVLVAVGAFAMLLPASASAHAFLIRSNPQAGARLASSPRTMTLYYSEAVARGSERVSIRLVGGATLNLAAPQVADAVIRQSLPPRLHGVFVVSWRVVSADDGHVTLGE